MWHSVGAHCSQAIFYGGLVPPTTWQEIVTCICVGFLGYGAQVHMHLLDFDRGLYLNPKFLKAQA